MRKRYALLAVVPFAILAACEESENGGSLDLNLDGGQPALDGAPQPPPPPPADAGDAGPQPVSITVTRAGAPVANVPVVFHDAAGVVLATVTTSATGVAAQLVPAGSQVTVVSGTADAPHLLTITEVEPGDVLTTVVLPTDDGSHSVSVTSVPNGAPASSTWVANAGRCTGNPSVETPLGVEVDSQCQQGGTFPVLVVAYDQETSAEVGFTFKKGNPLAADGGTAPNVDVSQAWSTSLRTHTIQVNNVPPSGDAYTTFSEVASGVARPNRDSFYNESQADTVSMQTSHAGHEGYPDFIQSELVRRNYQSGDMSVTGIATREAPPTGAATTSFNFADLLPYVAETKIDETATERPSVTWKAEEGKSLDTADGVYVYLRWYVSVNESFKFGDWTFVTPANRTTVKAPQVPANLTDFAPPAADAGEANFLTPATVTVVEGAAISGYRDFRKVSASVSAAAALEWSNGSNVFIPPLPAAGTLRATAYTRSND